MIRFAKISESAFGPLAEGKPRAGGGNLVASTLACMLAESQRTATIRWADARVLKFRYTSEGSRIRQNLAGLVWNSKTKFWRIRLP